MPPPLPQTGMAVPPTVQVSRSEPNATQPSVSQIRPWIRFWARFIDVGGICLAVAFPIAMLMGLLFATVLPFLGRETAVVLSVLFPYVVGLVVPFAYCFIEPIFFIIFGTTPGKALLCIDVRTTSSGRLSYNEALKRTLRVWFYGCAMGTIVGFGTLWKARNNLIEGKITTWDRLGSFRVSHRRIGAVRGTIATVLILVIYVIWAGLREESRERSEIPGSASPSRVAQHETSGWEKPFVETWPAGFSAETSASSLESRATDDQFLPFYLKGSETEVKWLAAAYGYDLGMNKSIALLCAKFPSVKARLLAGKAGYDRRFGPAVENILRVLESHVPEWEKVRTKLRSQVEELISAKNFSPETLEAAVCEVESRGNGKVDSPILETLLIYHPNSAA